MINILVFILILVVLIVLHEMGHMVVAKLSGMRVEKFFVFFGKPLWSFRRGETEYGVGWLPLGGFVKITGMTREELVKREYDPQTGEVTSETPEPPEVQARAYCNATAPRKIATIFAGPLANVIVAIIAFAASFWVGLPVFDSSPSLRTVAAGQPAAVAGLQPGDLIQAVNGVPVPSGADGDADRLTPVRNELERNVGKPVTVTYVRDGIAATTTTPPLAADPNDATKGRLGIQFDSVQVGTERSGPIEGIGDAFRFTGFLTVEQVKALGRLFTDQKTREEVQSVVGIGATYNEFAQDGAGTILRFIGILSLILAIMNLVPLLPLDGGHIVFALAERVKRRPMKIAVYQRASVIGIAIVGVLFIYALTNDVGRLLGEGFRP